MTMITRTARAMKTNLLSRSLAEPQAPRLRGIGILPTRTAGVSNNGKATVRRPEKRVR